MLLLRALVARFWQQPYEGRLVRWGTALHDRWLLPHFVAPTSTTSSPTSTRVGYPFDREWFAPFVEFRFPRFGTVTYDGVTIELRQAIEPWHVLGEEVSGTRHRALRRFVGRAAAGQGHRHDRASAIASPATAARCRCRRPACRANSSPACAFARGVRRPRCIRRSACRRRSCSISSTPGPRARSAAARITSCIRAGATTTRFRSTPTKPRRAASRASGRTATRRAA